MKYTAFMLLSQIGENLQSMVSKIACIVIIGKLNFLKRLLFAYLSSQTSQNFFSFQTQIYHLMQR